MKKMEKKFTTVTQFNFRFYICVQIFITIERKKNYLGVHQLVSVPRPSSIFTETLFDYSQKLLTTVIPLNMSTSTWSVSPINKKILISIAIQHKFVFFSL